MLLARTRIDVVFGIDIRVSQSQDCIRCLYILDGRKCWIFIVLVHDNVVFSWQPVFLLLAKFRSLPLSFVEAPCPKLHTAVDMFTDDGSLIPPQQISSPTHLL